VIPRIIHQTFPGDVLPDQFRANVEQIRDRNPGWEYRLYGDADVEAFIERRCDPAMLALYRSISPLYGAARADLFRYLVVYHEGGVYLDIKSAADRPFDEVLTPTDAFIVAQWDNDAGQLHEGWGMHRDLHAVPGGEFEQWFIAAAPHHPFLAAVIERVAHRLRTYHPLRDGVGLAVVRLTGPIPYTLAIAPLLDSVPHRRVRDHRALGLRYSGMAGRTHRAVFRTHYSQLLIPIVDARRGAIARAGIWAILRVKAWRRRLLKLDAETRPSLRPAS
jgi:hypothetical protein